ncbi:MAG: hypothetical protein ABI369_04885 [Acetobacteraceae bacterium]
MNLDLPESARIHILIAPAATGAPLPIGVAFPETVSAAGSQPMPPVSPMPPALPRAHHRVLKGAAVLALVGLAFVAGERVSPQDRAVPAAQARTYQLPSSPPNQIPPAFRQQLATPPRVTPPPGAAAPAAKPGEDAFGLEN